MGFSKKRVLSAFCCGVICFILVVVGLVPIFHGVFGKDPEIAIAEESTVKISVPFDAVFFYEETVLYAKDNGVLEPRFSQGDLVTEGMSVTVEGTGSEYRAPHSGMIQYEIDGCESLPFPNDLSAIDGDSLWKRVEEGEPETSPLKDGTSMCHNGEMLYKIVNTKKAIQCFVRLEHFADSFDLMVENSYDLVLDDTSAEGLLLGVHFGENSVYAVFLLEPRDQWFENRLTKGSLILSSAQGVTVDNEAITEYNGKKGIYLVDDGMISFCPLEITLKGETRTVVQGVDIGSAYLLSPDDGADRKFLRN